MLGSGCGPASRLCAVAALLLLSPAFVLGQASAANPTTSAPAQTNQNRQPQAQNDQPQVTPSLVVSSRLVLVPVTVATKRGEPVFMLKANDFTVTDDGVPQTVHLEPDMGATPLALVIVIQAGGLSAEQLARYRNLMTLVGAMVDAVPHRVAVISFDSKPKLIQDFTDDLDVAGHALEGLQPGDQGAAIFDGLGMAIDILSKQPETYRRQILLISETIDRGSERSVDAALRSISDTNTTIYSLGFSTTGARARHEAGKIYNDPDPEPAGGCMSRDANSDAGAQKSRAAQAYDCAGVLLPPLALAKVLEEAVRSGLKQNVPRTVAQVSGGEYFEFKDARSFERDLFTISNRMPNRYLLSFRPQSPHPGMHVLTVRLPDYPQLRVRGRRGYWMDADPAGNR